MAIPIKPDGKPAPEAAPGSEVTAAQHDGFWGAVEDQFALRQLISEYLIPAETNNLWYTLGGVLAGARQSFG